MSRQQYESGNPIFCYSKKRRKQKTNQQTWSKIACAFCSKYCLVTQWDLLIHQYIMSSLVRRPIRYFSQLRLNRQLFRLKTKRNILVDTNDLIVVIIMTDDNNLLSQKLQNWVRKSFKLPSTKYKKKGDRTYENIH